MKLDNQTLLLILAGVAVAAGLYWYFFTGTQSAAPLTTTASDNTGAQVQFQTLISELGTVSFNLAIFSDPRFTSMVSLATPIAQENVGRADPFAPLPGQKSP